MLLSQILSIMLYKKKPFILRLYTLQWFRLKNIYADLLQIKIDFTLLQHIPKLLMSNNLFYYSQQASNPRKDLGRTRDTFSDPDCSFGFRFGAPLVSRM